MRKPIQWSLPVVTVCGALLACGGGTQSGQPDTHVDDRLAAASAPKREVPKASELVKQGEQKLQAQDPAGAQALFEQAIAEAPDDPRAHLDLGIALEMQGDVDGAEASYRRAIQLQGDLAEALNNLAVLRRAHGDLDEAVALLERAAQANPGSAAAQSNLALALEDKGDLPAAERAYRKALSLDDSAVMTRVNLALLLIDLGKGQEALKHLRQSMPEAEGNRAALLASGNGFRRAGDADAAGAAMQAAVAAGEAATPALLSELALAQRAAGDREAAIATLEKALQMDAKYATAHYLLGNMLAGAKKFTEAKKHYQRYLKLDPNGPHAKRARERLEMVRKAK